MDELSINLSNNLSNNLFYLILVIIIIYILLPPENTKLYFVHGLYFEIFEMVSILILLFYSINYSENSFLNSFILSVAFIEHIRQYIFNYMQNGKGLRNLLSGIIYLILAVYNIIHLNYIFIFIWSVGILFKIYAYLNNSGKRDIK